ncbi:MAG TPA: hypothetical protein VJ805_15135 [Nitrospiraceae bacterium]|nr:hypothetical protein [Nitrospiraceae bacterium]
MDTKDALRRLADAAERFVNKAPNQKRLETERVALLDAILQAQLLLSVKRQGPPERNSATTPKPSKQARLRLTK